MFFSHGRDLKDGLHIKERLGSKDAKDLFEQSLKVEKENKNLFNGEYYYHYIILFCIALHCIVLFCIALYCIVLYYIILYYIILYYIILYSRDQA